MRVEITKPGRSKAVTLATNRLVFSATCRITLLPGTVASYSLISTIGEDDWEEHEDVPVGTTESATACFRDPVKQVALLVEEISGPGLVLTTLQAGD